MEQQDIIKLINVYHRRLALVSMDFKRYLHKSINWDARMIGIKGARGVGKTTLVLQHIKETFTNVDDTLWVSLDNLWFKTHDVDELVEHLYVRGIRIIFFDEVHKCRNWAEHLKNFYDEYPDLRIVYTGSSMLEIDNSKIDLARRQILYTLSSMSFREYLEYVGELSIPAISIEHLLSNHVEIAMDVTAKTKVMHHFDDYINHGCYPFFKEAGLDFHQQLAATVNLVIESDMVAVTAVTYATIEKTKKLLSIIASNVPFVPNVAKLCAALETTRDSCLRMLYALERANILSLLTRELKSYKHLVSPEKVYLNNTNLMESLASKSEIGNKRETFFMNQVEQVASIQSASKGDFLVSGKYLFEVGGADKTFLQIKDIPDSYLAVDDTEIGHGNRIPLWMFGLLY